MGPDRGAGRRRLGRGQRLTPRLRAVFAGTSEFAAAALRRLPEVAEVVGVITQPDRRGDRGKPAPRPVADLSQTLGVPLLRPERLRAPEAIAEVLALGADVLVVAAYGQIVPTALLDGHRLGGVNVHGSVLPRWRGASPIAHGIWHGDEQAGISIMAMAAGLDTGPVYSSQGIPIPARATTGHLTPVLAELGGEMLVAELPRIAAGMLAATPQPEEGVTLAPRLRREDGEVDWARHGAAEVDRMIRAFDPWPGAVASLAGTPVRMWAAEVLPGGRAEVAGAVVGVSGGAVDVATVDGVLRLLEVQAPGRKRMAAADYLRGRRLASPH